MSVQDVHPVAEHLVVHSPQPVWTAGFFHRLAKQRDVEEKRLSALPLEVGQVVGGRVVRQ